MAHHIMVPKKGVAVHINAFNFPVWGMLEKCAVNWMAGVPAVVLPAPSSSYLAEAVAREIIASGILPEGALQIINGTVKNILDTVEENEKLIIKNNDCQPSHSPNAPNNLTSPMPIPSFLRMI